MTLPEWTNLLLNYTCMTPLPPPREFWTKAQQLDAMCGWHLCVQWSRMYIDPPSKTLYPDLLWPPK